MSTVNTRKQILLAFEGRPLCFVSGISLARQLGITRTSVWKHVEALKAEGWPVVSKRGEGYRFTQPFDFSLLRSSQFPLPYFWKVRYEFDTVSTQVPAKEAAESGLSEGHLWLAERQTAGRGRLDRTWESPLGGLWMSFLLRPQIAAGRVPSLTLVTALILQETVKEICGLDLRLKWPNDLVIETAAGWKKVGGILTEMSGETDRTRWVVMGVGMNVNNTMPKSLRHIATSLVSLKDRVGLIIPRVALLTDFLQRFHSAYLRFQKQGFEPFRPHYWQMYSRPDEPVSLRTSQGVLRGIARGVDAYGALVVESHKQIQYLREGEIVS